VLPEARNPNYFTFLARFRLHIQNRIGVGQIEKCPTNYEIKIPV
jgi:hypothetical protein